MLDSAIEPSYSLSKNIVLLPGMLKMMVEILDMVNYSTPGPVYRRVKITNDKKSSLQLITRGFRLFYINLVNSYNALFYRLYGNIDI